MKNDRRRSKRHHESLLMPNNTINTDDEPARAFSVHVFAAGYGWRYAG